MPHVILDEATYASCNTCCDQLFVFLQVQGPDALWVCTANPPAIDLANVPIELASVAVPAKFKMQSTYIYMCIHRAIGCFRVHRQS